MMETNYHSPVLLKESVDGLNILENGIYVDVTFGGGGHSKEILRRLGSEGALFAFDQAIRSRYRTSSPLISAMARASVALAAFIYASAIFSSLGHR